MKLSEIFEPDNIIPDLKAKDKKGGLEELCEPILVREPSLNKASLVRALLDRERLGSTGIGDGVAIPHGKLPGIRHAILVFGRSQKGLDFESIDGMPAHLLFLLVVPRNRRKIHLKTLAIIEGLMKNGSSRKGLMQATTRAELYKRIVQDDEEF